MIAENQLNGSLVADQGGEREICRVVGQLGYPIALTTCDVIVDDRPDRAPTIAAAISSDGR
jgi:hypothetical protein